MAEVAKKVLNRLTFHELAQAVINAAAAFHLEWEVVEQLDSVLDFATVGANELGALISCEHVSQ